MIKLTVSHSRSFLFLSPSGSFVLYRRIVEELLRLADDLSGAANIDVVRTVRDVVRTDKCAYVPLYKQLNDFLLYNRNTLRGIRS